MSLLDASALPRMLRVRQEFPQSTPLKIPASVAEQISRVQDRLVPGTRVALTVGSRGIANIRGIVLAVLGELKAAGVEPFIVPAMGSHGGATPEGQKRILADYGITEQTMGVPIEAAMETREIGRTQNGIPAFTSSAALSADGIVVLNRVKPHTDYFSRSIGSGLIKMMVVGMGKHDGAANFHRTAVHHGYADTLKMLGRVVLDNVPILFGIGLVENQYHQTVRLEAVLPEQIETQESELLDQAASLMPGLPFEEMDLLIVDRIGKNISGVGMDPNVIGRHAHHYSTLLNNELECNPFIRRIFVRGLTPETHGNAIGIGLADATHEKLAAQMDAQSMFVNVRTSLTLHSAKLPMQFPSDRTAISALLDTLALDDSAQARVVRISNTLELAQLEISEPLAAVAKGNDRITIGSDSFEWAFDPEDNL
ncbi:MAG: lactate racemase domain-containing protein, partial [Verrucomicrobiota bacterium]|nr:lactate racemase domain-containing protein [Verrucomicrobiota bacterium]